MNRYIYGIDIGGTSVKIGLFTPDGTMVDRWTIPTDTTDSGINIIRDIAQAIQYAEVPLANVIGYGFGVPGPVVNNIVKRCVNLGWKNYDIVTEFNRYIEHDTVFVANDANLAALGESFVGAAQNYRSSATITIGTGVGGGLIVNDQIINGEHGTAGEIGHLQVHSDHPRLCNCGHYGCLETIASASGIHQEFKYLKEHTNLTSSLRKNKEASAKEIFDAAKEGDELATRIVDTVAETIGYACYVWSVTSNPSIIVIGGGVGKAGSFFIDKIQKVFEEATFKEAKHTPIVPAILGNDAGMYGAASLVLHHD